MKPFLLLACPFDLRRLAGVLLSAGWVAFAQAGQSQCQVSLSPAVIDFGRVTGSQLETQGGRRLLGERVLQLRVACDRPTELQLAYRAPARDASHYRFGAQGAYGVTLGAVRLDGRQATLAQEHERVHESGPVQWLPGQSLVPLVQGATVAASTLTATVSVKAWLDAGASGPSQIEELDASARVDVATASTPLLLKAQVIPAACNLHLGNGGRADFGTLSSQQLQNDRFTTLYRTLGMAVTCDGPARYALRALDNRSATPLLTPDTPPGGLFGLGASKRGSAFGGYALRVLPTVRGDGIALRPIQALAGTGWADVHGASYLRADQHLLGFTRGPATPAGPDSVSHLEGQLQVELTLAPLQQLSLADEQVIDGAATLEIVYL